METYSKLVLLAFDNTALVPWPIKNQWLNCLALTNKMNFMVTRRYDNKAHTYGYLPESNPIWRFFPLWLGLGMDKGLPRFQNTSTGRVNGCTHPECKKSIHYPFYININSNLKSFHWHNQSLRTLTFLISLSSSISHTIGLSLFHQHSNRSISSFCWIMH